MVGCMKLEINRLRLVTECNFLLTDKENLLKILTAFEPTVLMQDFFLEMFVVIVMP